MSCEKVVILYSNDSSTDITERPYPGYKKVVLMTPEKLVEIATSAYSQGESDRENKGLAEEYESVDHYIAALKKEIGI